VCWCFQWVSWLEVWTLQEVTTTGWEEENHPKENDQEDDDTDQIMHGVVRMERNTIEWHTIFVFLLLNIHAIWVVRANMVQCNQVHKH